MGYKTIDENSIKLLLNEKKQIISQTEILEYWSVTETISKIGGVDNLKDWLKKRKTSFGGIVGESESRLRQMIEVAEAISPCILWIDEIDKAFSNNSNTGDSGTSNRVLATFISWLSEKTKPVFVVATANNVDLLPLEILRKGRFDEIFFLDLPRKQEREQIFKIHIQEFRPNRKESFDYSN